MGFGRLQARSQWARNEGTVTPSPKFCLFFSNRFWDTSREEPRSEGWSKGQPSRKMLNIFHLILTLFLYHSLHSAPTILPTHPHPSILKIPYTTAPISKFPLPKFWPLSSRSTLFRLQIIRLWISNIPTKLISIMNKMYVIVRTAHFVRGNYSNTSILQWTFPAQI